MGFSVRFFFSRTFFPPARVARVVLGIRVSLAPYGSSTGLGLGVQGLEFHWPLVEVISALGSRV